MSRNPVLRITARFLLPFILVFALYVQAHGDYGPGGGFQAGVIFAAGIILYGLIFGLAAMRAFFPPLWAQILMPLGLSLYGAVGVAGIILEGTFLDYDVLPDWAGTSQITGILLVELGVGLTVAGTMLALFYAFVGRGGDQ